MNELERWNFGSRFLCSNPRWSDHGVTASQIYPADTVGLGTITTNFRRQVGSGFTSDDLFWIIWRLRYLWRTENKS